MAVVNVEIRPMRNGTCLSRPELTARQTILVGASGRHKRTPRVNAGKECPNRWSRTVLPRGPVGPGLASIVAEVNVYGSLSEHVLARIAWSR